MHASTLLTRMKAAKIKADVLLGYKSRVFMQIVDLSLECSTVHVMLLEDILKFPLESQLLLSGVVIGLVNLMKQLGKSTS